MGKFLIVYYKGDITFFQKDSFLKNDIYSILSNHLMHSPIIVFLVFFKTSSLRPEDYISKVVFVGHYHDNLDTSFKYVINYVL
jgi:hypothetical protein